MMNLPLHWTDFALAAIALFSFGIAVHERMCADAARRQLEDLRRRTAK